jgi:hypothetical protein
MKLPLRINFEDKDYTYVILNPVLNRDTTEFHISLAGEELTLLRDEKKDWYSKTASPNHNPDLLKAIGRTIALRFKL